VAGAEDFWVYITDRSERKTVFILTQKKGKTCHYVLDDAAIVA
jgi:hypothetical protein